MTRILVVDDDHQVSEQIAVFLEPYGYDTLFLLEPEYLFQMLDEKEIDLILLDIHMPGIDGVSLLKQLKEHPVFHLIPIIMLTGDTDQRLLSECFEAGAMDFLHKPLREVELKARIKSALAIQGHIREIESINLIMKRTFEGMAEGVVQLDSNFSVQMISSKACHLLGISQEEAIGSPAAQIIGAPIAGPAGELINSVHEVEMKNDVQTEILIKNGIKIPINLTIIPLHAQSRKRGWLLLFRDLRKEERLLREKAKSVSFGRMVSCDPKMNQIFELIEKISMSTAAVLIKGESGTGKELAAREIHDRSRNAQGPFHAVNCSAISPNLLESEFFGHEKGSFTGANRQKKGRFELADQGTLFLDEVGDIPLEMQGKLLRALQEQEFERVGGTQTIQVKVRVIAATNKDLKTMVHEHQFRDDLYYRLHVIPLYLPPLRERLQDIPLLISAFFEELNRKEERAVHTISPDALNMLFSYNWPGNIRELYNVIEYAFAVSKGQVIQKKHLPDILSEVISSPVQTSPAPQNEKELILQALQQTNFSKPKAASLLGIHRTTLYRKLKKYGFS